MKNKKEHGSENYLERKPKRAPGIAWSVGRDGIVTLDIENTGLFNRIAQKLLHKPEFTHVHLDKFGSFLWPVMDGELDIIALGTMVESQFGEEASPLYERLAKYFQILDSYHFVEWK